MNTRQEMNDRVSVLIVAERGALGDGLEALLMAMPQIEVVERIDNARSALKLVAKQHPTLVVLDVEALSDESGLLLERLKIVSSQTRRLVLAGTVQQKQEVEASNAEAVLLKGASAAELVAAIEKLLGQEG